MKLLPWYYYISSQVFYIIYINKVKSMYPQHPLKIVAISDTHGNNDKIKHIIQQKQKGDIFIHAGDFTSYCKKSHFQQFTDLMAQLDFQYKIVIPGNHEIILDQSHTKQDLKISGRFNLSKEINREDILHKLKVAGCLYYEHDYFQVKGLKVFASAYTPIPFYYKTGFQCSQNQLECAWEGVPIDIDLLITHGPPFEILDKSIQEGIRCGCKVLRKYLEKTKARVHIFGHIHQAKGTTQFNNTICYNVAEKLHYIYLNNDTVQKSSKDCSQPD